MFNYNVDTDPDDEINAPDFPGYLYTDVCPNQNILSAREINISFNLDRFYSDAVLAYARYGSETNNILLDGSLIVQNIGVAEGGPWLFSIDLGDLAPGNHIITIVYTGGAYDNGNFIDAISLSGNPTTPIEIVDVSVDIKPGSCPNPVNVKNKGMLPVAILGTEEFEVSIIDPASIFLNGVPAIRSSYDEDVGGPLAELDECECTTDGPDGFGDLTLKFYTQQIVDTLGEVNTDDILTLPLTGVLNDGTPIEGSDCVVIVGRHKPINKADINKDGVVNTVDMAIVAENWLQSSIVE